MEPITVAMTNAWLAARESAEKRMLMSRIDSRCHAGSDLESTMQVLDMQFEVCGYAITMMIAMQMILILKYCIINARFGTGV